MSQDTLALEIAGLGFKYGDKIALDDVSFTVANGQFKVLLGPNGAGKTTFFSLLTRLYVSARGQIRVNGANLRDAPRQALAQMGIVFQQPTLDLDLNVRQNLLYHAALHGMKKSHAIERIETELTRLGMLERQYEKTRQLNGGHRRRVEIARALLHQPKMLLLDEPTVGLDVPSRRDIVEYVHRMAREQNMAILWSTHLIDEIFDDDSVIVLNQGRVCADGSVTEVTASVGAENIAQAFSEIVGDSPT
ncbi:MAG: ATP-binding cassette domain-containing protein [Gammaproteobacteria bacterium]|nr:ATP-binding cassette domain-containing protein [Gammaproteobacteria bacterium]